jgi:methionyl-tRNA formyltransferase
MVKRLSVVFIGCVKSSAAALDALIADPMVELRALVTFRESPFNSDFVDLAPRAALAGIPVAYAEDYPGDELADVFAKHPADLAIAVGWSRLLPRRVLNAPRIGVVGFHPAALPGNRGRHPVIWAIALGLRSTASTFFLMDEGADSGPILSQKRVEIAERETAGSLYEKLLGLIPEQVAEIVSGLNDGSLRPRPQDHSKATYWRKRSRADGLIDWRMSATQIDRLVRALAPPYPCAEIEFDKHRFQIVHARPCNVDEFDCEPGKVLRVTDSEILVKAGEGAVAIEETNPALMVHEGLYL